jgi:tetratricopeptide (TPR) repeat protein
VCLASGAAWPRAAFADAQEALQQAAALVQQGRLDDAARQAEVALADPEVRAGAYSVLGAIRLRQQRLDESARCLEEALRLDPGLRGAQLNLTHVYLAQAEKLSAAKDAGAAAALVRKWSALGAVPPAAAMRFGTLLAEGGGAPEAVRIFEGLAASGPASYELSFNLGSAYVRSGDPARALAAYDAALARLPNALPALTQAAAVAERSGELERSLSYWLRAKKLAPEDPEILLGFGRVCLTMDLLEDAEPALEQAARLRPDSVPHQYTLAAAKVGKKQFEAAQRLLEPLAAARPLDPHLQYALGAIFYAQGRHEEAEPRLKESVRLLPSQVAAPYYLALVARDQGHDADAIAQLDRFVAQHPDHAGAHEALGGLLMSARRHEDAEAHLRKAIALSPGSVKANYQLGLLLARMGRKGEADTQLAHATTLREDDAAQSRLQLRLLDPDR